MAAKSAWERDDLDYDPYEKPRDDHHPVPVADVHVQVLSVPSEISSEDGIDEEDSQKNLILNYEYGTTMNGGVPFRQLVSDGGEAIGEPEECVGIVQPDAIGDCMISMYADGSQHSIAGLIYMPMTAPPKASPPALKPLVAPALPPPPLQNVRPTAAKTKPSEPPVKKPKCAPTPKPKATPPPPSLGCDEEKAESEDPNDFEKDDFVHASQNEETDPEAAHEQTEIILSAGAVAETINLIKKPELNGQV